VAYAVVRGGPVWDPPLEVTGWLPVRRGGCEKVQGGSIDVAYLTFNYVDANGAVGYLLAQPRKDRFSVFGPSTATFCVSPAPFRRRGTRSSLNECPAGWHVAHFPAKFVPNIPPALARDPYEGTTFASFTIRPDRNVLVTPENRSLGAPVQPSTPPPATSNTRTRAPTPARPTAPRPHQRALVVPLAALAVDATRTGGMPLRRYDGMSPADQNRYLETLVRGVVEGLKTDGVKIASGGKLGMGMKLHSQAARVEQLFGKGNGWDALRHYIRSARETSRTHAIYDRVLVEQALEFLLQRERIDPPANLMAIASGFQETPTRRQFP